MEIKGVAEGKTMTEEKKCPFPRCTHKVVDSLPGRQLHGFCLYHENMVEDLCFILPHIKLQQTQPKITIPRIILPGQPGFGRN